MEVNYSGSGQMIRKTFVIKNKFGLHARPAHKLVNTAGRFKSSVEIIKDGHRVNAKSIMGVLTLAAEPGSEIEVIVQGEDEVEAMKAIEELILNNFGEE